MGHVLGQPPVAVRPKTGHWKLWLLLLLLILPAIVILAYSWMVMRHSYSSGDHTGHLQKLPQKGETERFVTGVCTLRSIGNGWKSRGFSINLDLIS
jgi:hypothetical protein